MINLKKSSSKTRKYFSVCLFHRVYPEVYSFVEKRGIEFKNNIHLKFKDWKDRKKYSQIYIEGYFPKSESSSPPPCAIPISLPRNRIHKREETKRLNNLPSNFVESFYKDWLDGIDFSQETDFQQQLVNNTPRM